MNNKRISGYIIGAVLVIIGIFITVTYNGLVGKEENVKLQWNEMQANYQRRLDLVPNLVTVVKGQTDFEQTTLQQIAEARAKAASVITSPVADAGGYQKNIEAQNQLADAANRLVVVIEKYPNLSGAEAFKGLQTQLEGTERRIKFSRKDFNESIATYNNAVRSFPSKIVAALFGFKAKEGFQSDAGAEKAVEIKF